VKTRTMKITHFFMDEEKFFETTFKIFNQDALENHWYISCEDGKKKQWSKEPLATIIDFADYKKERFNENLKNDVIRKSQITIFHYFDAKYLPFYHTLVKSHCVILQLWGGDYTAQTLRPSELLGRRSFEECIQPFSKTNAIPSRIARLYYDVKWLLNKSRRSYLQALSEANHVGLELGDFEKHFFNLRINRINGMHIPYSADIRSVLEVEPALPNGNNVLLGNSAALTNSHIDVLELLKEKRTQFAACILPLSYGGNEDVVQSISSFAEKHLPSQHKILNTFLSREEYFEILNSCSIVIMNHTRQQALGNILWAIANCRTLYLNPKGVIFNRLREIGIFAHSTHAIPKNGLQPFSMSQLIANRDALRQFYPEKIDIKASLQEILNTQHATK